MFRVAIAPISTTNFEDSTLYKDCIQISTILFKIFSAILLHIIPNLVPNLSFLAKIMISLSIAFSFDSTSSRVLATLRMINENLNLYDLPCFIIRYQIHKVSKGTYFSGFRIFPTPKFRYKYS